MNIYNLINEDDDTIDNNSDNICLITGNILTDNYITLDCNHKFNYKDLYYEFKYQKTVNNSKIVDNPAIHQIKCPYCRSLTNKLLPYFKSLLNDDILPIFNKNTVKKYEMIQLYECQYINKQNIQCKNNACITKFGLLCDKHYSFKLKSESNKHNKIEYKKNNIKHNNNSKNESKNKKIIDYNVINNHIINEEYDKLLLYDLKKLLKLNKCKISGNKKEIIERIKEKKCEFNKNNIVWIYEIF